MAFLSAFRPLRLPQLEKEGAGGMGGGGHRTLTAAEWVEFF